MNRAHYVTSADGTRIGYVSSGTGPPLVMVHGAMADHTVLSLVRPLLEPHFTVHAVDRRGRGMSGDAASYDVSLEYADIARVVDEVAARSGDAVSLYGHSYGGLCALGAAALTSNLRQLLLYEPAFRGVVVAAAGVLDRLEELVSRGQADAAVEFAYREAVGVSPRDVAVMREHPSWPARVAAAATIPREFRTAATVILDPAACAAVDVPSVLLLGDQSAPGQQAVVAALRRALPSSELAPLVGQGHAAQVTAPELVADVLRARRPAAPEQQRAR